MIIPYPDNRIRFYKKPSSFIRPWNFKGKRYISLKFRGGIFPHEIIYYFILFFFKYSNNSLSGSYQGIEFMIIPYTVNRIRFYKKRLLLFLKKNYKTNINILCPLKRTQNYLLFYYYFRVLLKGL